MAITINNEQRRTAFNEGSVKRLIKKTLKALRMPPESSLGINFVTRAKIRSLNRRYFKKDRVTDVMAFEYDAVFKAGRIFRDASIIKDKAYRRYLGDIILCPSVVMENSKAYGSNFPAELSLCVVHGVLHLLGFDDRTGRGRLKMRKKEELLLRAYESK